MKYLWLFDHDALMVTPLVTSVLWALGGSGIKCLRRLGVGLFLALSALSLGCPWYLAGMTFVILFLTTSLPYGDSVRGKLGIVYYPYLFILGVLYGLSNFSLCFYSGGWLTLVAYSLALGCLFSLLTFASQSEAFKNVVSWKKVEIATGFGAGFIAYKLYL